MKDEMVSENIDRAQRVLSARKRLEGRGLTTLQWRALDELLDRISDTTGSEDGSPEWILAEAVKDYLWDSSRKYHIHGFEGMSFPVVASQGIVRCVHEGICPTCGLTAYLKSSERVKVANPNPQESDGWGLLEDAYISLPEHDTRELTTVICPKDHEHYAEPTLHDWVGY